MTYLSQNPCKMWVWRQAESSLRVQEGEARHPDTNAAGSPASAAEHDASAAAVSPEPGNPGGRRTPRTRVGLSDTSIRPRLGARRWAGSSAIRLSPPQIRACGCPAVGSS